MLKNCATAGRSLASVATSSRSCCPGAAATAAGRVAQQLVEALNRPFDVEDFMLSVEASVGVAVYPEDGDSSGTLLRCADVAMYRAKAAHSGWQRYDARGDVHSRQRLALIGQVKEAIKQGEFVLHHQPKLDLRTGQIVGVESLVRWQHPELGLLPPGEFVPLIERTVQMAAFTPHIIQMALEDAAVWRAHGFSLNVAVNVPINNLYDRASRSASEPC